jgi:tRNA-binding protein
MIKDSVGFESFSALDIRVGTVKRVEIFAEARKPAYKLWVDFGEEVGVLKSSAQITDCYNIEALIDMQVMGVVNFEPRQIANFMSECLILGIYTERGVVLIIPKTDCKNGEKLG